MMKRPKVSCEEPAPRDVTLSLSTAEVIALSNYHVAHSQRLTNKVGKIVLGSLGFRVKGPAMHLVSGQIKAHQGRAKEILVLAQASLIEKAGSTSVEQLMQKKRKGKK